MLDPRTVLNLDPLMTLLYLAYLHLSLYERNLGPNKVGVLRRVRTRPTSTISGRPWTLSTSFKPNFSVSLVSYSVKIKHKTPERLLKHRGQ